MDIGRAFDGFLYLALFAFLLLPLGLWKLVEIIIWRFKHIKIGIE